jgi:RNA polymerase sigma-70 factor (ECF subfamily)
MAAGAEPPGRYYLEALIASVHCNARDWASTDREQLLFLYTLLERIAPSQAITLNRIVTIAHAGDPHGALEELLVLERSGGIVKDHPYHASLADIQRRCGYFQEAIGSYLQAVQAAPSPIDKRFYQKRIEQCTITS